MRPLSTGQWHAGLSFFFSRAAGAQETSKISGIVLTLRKVSRAVRGGDCLTFC